MQDVDKDRARGKSAPANPRKIYSDQLAARCRENAGQSYLPSNGGEGRAFDEAWCSHCRRDQEFRETENNGCPIIAATMCLDPEQPGYPEEWIYDSEGQPCCTAFDRILPEGTQPRCERTADMFDV